MGAVKKPCYLYREEGLTCTSVILHESTPYAFGNEPEFLTCVESVWAEVDEVKPDGRGQAQPGLGQGPRMFRGG